jgi:hypothetical protein
MNGKRIFVYAAGLLLPIGLTLAANEPSMKEGLWTVHTVSTNNPGNTKSEGTISICRNHAYDESVEAAAKTKRGCTTVSESFEGGKRSVVMHCTVATTAVDTKAVTTFDGENAAHSEVHATYTPPLAGISEMTMVQDQKYMGACPAGAQPGDRIAPDGTITHAAKH